MAFIAPSTKIIGFIDDDVRECQASILGAYYGGQQGGLIDNVFYQDGQFGGWLGERTLKRFYHSLPGLVKSGLQTVRDTAMSGIRDFATDISKGGNWRSAGIGRLGELGGTLASKFGNKLASMMRGGGRRKRNKRRKAGSGRCSSLASTGRVTRRKRRRRKTTTAARRRTTRRRGVKRKTTTTRRRTRRTGVARKKRRRRQTGGGGEGYGYGGDGGGGGSWL
jgi:hypothetical protein